MEAETEPSTILVVEDDAVDREAIRRMLEKASPGYAVEEITNADDAFERLQRRDYLCAFVDHRLPGRSGLELLQQARQRPVLTPIVILTGYGDELLAVEALKAGAADYLPKSRASPERVRLCIESARALLRGRDGKACRLDRLTPREREVTDLLVQGKSNKQVAAELGISRRTVESHRAHIMEKLEVRSLAEMVRCVLAYRPPASPPP